MKRGPLRVAWRRLGGILCVGTLASTIAFAGALTKYVVIKVTELDGSASYKMMTSDEAKTIDKEIARDARFHAAALRKAAKAWKEDEDSGRSMFPRRAVSPRRLTVKGSYRTEKEAAKKLDRCMEQQYKKDAKEMAAARKRTRAIQRHPGTGAARKLRRQDAADEKMAKARTIYEAALAEVKGAAAAKK